MKKKVNTIINLVPFLVWMLWLGLALLIDEAIVLGLELIFLLASPLLYSLYNVFLSKTKKEFVIYNMIFGASHIIGHCIAAILCYSFIIDFVDIQMINIFSVISVFFILINTLISYGIRTIVDKTKHKVMVILSIIVVFVTLNYAIAFWIDPNLNKLKLKSVENNALEYIHDTYPDFAVDEISVVHEWKSNHYVVDYSDGKGDNRTVTFGHTGEKVSIDNYIHDKVYDIEYDYTNNVEAQITQALENESEIYVNYILIEAKNLIGREKDIALNGWDISKQPIVCSMEIRGTDKPSTLEFAKSAKEIYAIVSSLELPIEEIIIHQPHSPGGRFDIVCPDDMDELSIEQIEKLVER